MNQDETKAAEQQANATAEAVATANAAADTNAGHEEKQAVIDAEQPGATPVADAPEQTGVDAAAKAESYERVKAAGEEAAANNDGSAA